MCQWRMSRIQNESINSRSRSISAKRLVGIRGHARSCILNLYTVWNESLKDTETRTLLNNTYAGIINFRSMGLYSWITNLFAFYPREGYGKQTVDAFETYIEDLDGNWRCDYSLVYYAMILSMWGMIFFVISELLKCIKNSYFAPQRKRVKNCKIL